MERSQATVWLSCFPARSLFSLRSFCEFRILSDTDSQVLYLMQILACLTFRECQFPGHHRAKNCRSISRDSLTTCSVTDFPTLPLFPCQSHFGSNPSVSLQSIHEFTLLISTSFASGSINIPDIPGDVNRFRENLSLNLREEYIFVVVDMGDMWITLSL